MKKTRILRGRLALVMALSLILASVPSFTVNAAVTYGLGCIPATASQIAAMPKASQLATAAVLPVTVDWTSKYPAPGNQGAQGSCVGWAVAYAEKSMQEGIEYAWDLSTANHQFSPSYVYNQVNNGVDLGTTIYAAMQLVVNQGCCTLQTMPYNQSDFKTQPNAAQKAEAAGYKALSYAFLGNGASTAAIKQYVVQNYGVVLQIPVYSDFYNTGTPYYSTTGGLVGYHAVCLVGYDDNKTVNGAKGAFKFINSWGTGWGGLGGYGYISYSSMASLPDQFQAYAMTDIVTNVPVTCVSVSPISCTITAGSTCALSATVTPSNATNKSVTWTSSNTAVASVSSAGVITGVAPGTATVTVKTADGAKTATCAVTVTQAPVTLTLTAAANISIVNGSKTMVKFTPTVAGTYTFESTDRNGLNPVAYGDAAGNVILDNNKLLSLNYKFKATIAAGATYVYYSGIKGNSTGVYAVTVTKS